MELLTGLNRDTGLTVVMVTHEADIAAYAGARIGFLDGRGRVRHPDEADAA